MSTWHGKDNCTDLILDFIAGGVPDNPSGEAFGNYNAYFGRPRSKADLSKKTLKQIYEFQARMLRSDPRSTAIGRYQFLRRTAQGLQKKESLPDSTLFTPELQDRWGWILMVGRGYKSWWRGAISDEEFLSNLSAEWASLPDPFNGGKSHYDGDSVGNHASTTQAKALAMLRRARELQ